MPRMVAAKYRVYLDGEMIRECDSLMSALKAYRIFPGEPVMIYAVLENGVEVILR